MKTAVFVLVIIGLGMIPLGIFIVYYYWIQILNLFAETGKILTTVSSGAVKFRKKGESFFGLLFNKKELAYDDPNDRLYQIGDPGFEKVHQQNLKQRKSFEAWLEEKYGMYYVSIFYPAIETHVWMHSWEKLNSNVEEHDLFRVEHRKEPVDSLRIKYTYPVRVEEVEISGNLTIDADLRFILKVRRPRYLTFELRGDWVPAAITELSSLFTEYARDKEYESFQLLKEKDDSDKEKSESEESKAEKGKTEKRKPKKLKRSDFRKAFDKKLILEGALEISEAVFVDFQLSEGFQKVQDAVLAKAENERFGDAEIVKEQKNLTVAKLKADQNYTTVTRGGEADAKRLDSLLTAASRHHRGEDVLLAEINRETIQGAAQSGANITMWNGMGQAPVPMLSVGQQPPNGKIIIPDKRNIKSEEAA